MGTDIHVFMERKHNGSWVPVHPPEVKDPNDWEDFGRYADPIPAMEQLTQAVLVFEDRIPSVAEQWWVPRDYQLFTNLAGVRRYSEAAMFDDSRGLPADVSQAVAASIHGYHSESYWVLDELENEIHEADQESVSPRALQLVEAMWEIAKAYNLDNTEVRMVFGFDS